MKKIMYRHTGNMDTVTLPFHRANAHPKHWQTLLARVYTKVMHFYLQPSAILVEMLRALEDTHIPYSDTCVLQGP